MTPQRDTRTENILDYLSDLKNYPEKAPAPYEEFEVGGKSYYFTPGGSLYRQDGQIKEVRSIFFDSLSGELWSHKIDHDRASFSSLSSGSEGLD